MINEIIQVTRLPLTTPMTKSLKTVGEEAWKRVEKVNGELFVLTYGAIVSQLCRDCGAAGLPSVNDELYKM